EQVAVIGGAGGPISELAGALTATIECAGVIGLGLGLDDVAVTPEGLLPVASLVVALGGEESRVLDQCPLGERGGLLVELPGRGREIAAAIGAPTELVKGLFLERRLRFSRKALLVSLRRFVEAASRVFIFADPEPALGGERAGAVRRRQAAECLSRLLVA